MRFDPARLSFAELARAAREGGEIPVVYALDPAQEAASRPLFLGFVLGQYAAAGLWFAIDLCTGMRGNQVFWI